MTAEIAVLNKDAVALAADSAVTIGGQKTYQTTNKLFSLSRDQPVGVMIYGDAELCGVPWETIIKLFRKHIGVSEKNKLEDYVQEFISFIETKMIGHFVDDLEEHFTEYAENYLHKLADLTDSAVESALLKNPLTTRQIAGLLRKNINNELNKAKPKTTLKFSSSKLQTKLKNEFKSVVDELIDDILENHSVSLNSKNNILQTIVLIFCNKCVDSSGVVFSGFGTDEIFPKLIVNKIECLVFGKLKYTSRSSEVKNTENHESLIVPFAQKEIVATFVTGISHDMKNAVYTGLTGIYDNVGKALTDELDALNISKNSKNSLLRKLKKTYTESSEYLEQIVDMTSQHEHINPLLEAVEFLPKNELAEVAESLVSITSFRQKISLNQETVGGAIDVAVVSKTDGFVWIKRKHYFPGDLNPMFMSKYN